MFKSIHPPGVIEHMLDPSAYKGNVDPATLPETVSKEARGEEKQREITLGEIIGLPDFDVRARPDLGSQADDSIGSRSSEAHFQSLGVHVGRSHRYEQCVNHCSLMLG